MFLLLAVPVSAGAQDTFTPEAEACGGAMVNGAQVGSERGSGQMDAAGNLYLPCSANAATGAHDNYIQVFNAAGNRIRTIALDFPGAVQLSNGTWCEACTERASDVAPSPDGSFLYVIKYTGRKAYRFDRQADGSYRSNGTWALANYPGANGAGSYPPLGEFLATDASGFIYFSSGLWACNITCTDNAIVKFRPDGSYITRFGRRVDGSRALGHAAGSFGGVTVTADGRRVFAADINNSRIQRFVQQADGTYVADLEMGAGSDDEAGCYVSDALAAPYDVAMSAAGELLVINTTCYNDYVRDENGAYVQPYRLSYPDKARGTIEVKRFAQDGSLRGSGSIITVSQGQHRVHGIAVDRAGVIHLAQARMVLRPSNGAFDQGADMGGGGPMGGTAAVDATAPVISSLGATPTSTQGRDITLTIAATDASGISYLRIREDGVQGDWRPFAASVVHVITDRLGAHELVVEVQDGAGNVSAGAAITVTRVAPPAPATPAPTPTPTSTSPAPTAPAPTPTSPLQPTGGTVQGGGAAPAMRPTILKVSMPVQSFGAARVKIGLRASGIGGVTHVRFSTAGNGRWGAWRSISTASFVALPAGPGWKGVFIQIRDAAGTGSVPWFQPVLVGPRGVGWYKGSRTADTARLPGGTQHADISSFDQKVDRISCGAGFDTVLAQPEDKVARDCERVVRVVLPAW